MGGRAGADFALHRARRTFAGGRTPGRARPTLRAAHCRPGGAGARQHEGRVHEAGPDGSYLDTGLPRPRAPGAAGPAAGCAAHVARARRRRRGAGAGRPPRPSCSWSGTRCRIAVGLHRPGAPGHHPRRAGRGGQGPVPRSRRGHQVRPRQRRPALRRHGPGAVGLRAGSAGRGDPGPAWSRSSTTPTRPATSSCSPTSTAGHPFIHVPDVLMACRRRRVLTTELAEGVRFEEMATWDQDERNLAAEAIYRFVFRSLYRLQAFNGDPHPGQLPVPAGRPGHVPRLRAGQALHARGDRAVRRHDPGHGHDHDIAALPAHRASGIGMLAPGRARSDEQVRGLLQPLLRVRACTTRRSRSRPSGRPTVRRALRPHRPVRPSRQGGQPAAQLRDHPADQPRAHCHPRRAAGHGQLPGHRQRAVAVGRRRRRRPRWARPRPTGWPAAAAIAESS